MNTRITLTLLCIYLFCACGDSNIDSAEIQKQEDSLQLSVRDLPLYCESGELDSAVKNIEKQWSAHKDVSFDKSHYMVNEVMGNFLDEMKVYSFSSPDSGKVNCKQVGAIAVKYDKIIKLARENNSKNIQFNVGYSKGELEQVNQVFRDVGELIIDSKETRGTHSLASSQVPWAGYWYPYDKIERLVGESGPLDKFDNYLVNLGLTPGARTYEEDLVSQFRPDTWEGRCHAWAMAAVHFPEPRVPIRVKGVLFSVSDLKALYMIAMEATSFTRYGIQYQGSYETDGTFQDLRPEAFHALMLHYLSKNQAVVIDDDPGIEVWSKPVHGYRYKVTEVDKDYLEVESYVGLVKQRDDVTDELTGTRDITWRKYKYRLYWVNVDGNQNQYRIIRGEWIDGSVESHPDSVLVDNGGTLKSMNPIINNNIRLIEEFVQTSSSTDTRRN